MSLYGANSNYPNDNLNDENPSILDYLPPLKNHCEESPLITRNTNHLYAPLQTLAPLTNACGNYSTFLDWLDTDNIDTSEMDTTNFNPINETDADLTIEWQKYINPNGLGSVDNKQITQQSAPIQSTAPSRATNQSNVSDTDNLNTELQGPVGSPIAPPAQLQIIGPQQDPMKQYLLSFNFPLTRSKKQEAKNPHGTRSKTIERKKYK